MTREADNSGVGGEMARGEALLVAGRPREALEPLGRALAQQPDSPPILALLARAQSEAGEHRQAVDTAEQLVAAAPDDATGHALHGHLLSRAGASRPALKAADRALALDPTEPVALQLKALLELEVGDPGEARRAADRLRAVEPDESFAHRIHGRVCREERRWEDAEAAYRKAVELDPEDPTALHELGQLLAWLGRRDEGVALLQASVEADPEDRHLRTSAVQAAAIYDPRAWILPAITVPAAVAAALFGWGDLWLRFWIAAMAIVISSLQTALWWKDRRRDLPEHSREFLRRAVAEHNRSSWSDRLLLGYCLVAGFWLTTVVHHLLRGEDWQAVGPLEAVSTTLLIIGLPFLRGWWRRADENARGTVSTFLFLIYPLILVLVQGSAMREGTWHPTPVSLTVLMVSVLFVGYVAIAFWRGRRAG